MTGKGLSGFVLSGAAWAARLLPPTARQRLYRHPALARWIRRGLNRAAPQGLTDIEVAAGALAGMHLALDLQAEKDYWLGTYEPELQAALAELVQPGMIAYDVGANIGYISLMLALGVGENGQVFAFEALPNNVDRLKNNLALNTLGERVSVVPNAVIDARREVQFLVGPSGGMGKAQGSAGRQEVAYTQSININGISLDEFVFQLSHPAPDLIKIDIEGGEVLALPGMQRLLKENNPVVFLELHGPESAQAAWDSLSVNYRLCRMQAGFPPVTSPAELDWKAYVVAFPRQHTLPESD